MVEVTGYEMYPAEFELIEFLLDCRLEFNWIEQRYSPVFRMNRCCSIAYSNKCAVAQRYEAIERSTEGWGLGRNIADREPSG